MTRMFSFTLIYYLLGRFTNAAFLQKPTWSPRALQQLQQQLVD